MSREKLKEIQYNRFREVVESPKNKVWTINELLERINKMTPSNLELTKNGFRTLISNQFKFKVFRCRYIEKGKTTTYYIFRKCLPIKN